MSDCWLWRGTKDRDGYGRMKVRGRPRLAHRVVYERTYGPIPEGIQIDHRCRVRDCVRPDHLRLATPKQQSENRTVQCNSRSGVRGVIWKRGKWEVTVKHNRRPIYVGRFSDLDEAEAAAKAKRNELFTHNDLDRP